MIQIHTDNLDLWLKETVPSEISGDFGEEKARRALAFHRGLPAYRETPLISLKELARRLGLGGIYVKDESRRFGLNAFKGLGGSYAIFRILCEKLGLDPAASGFEDLQTPERRSFCETLTFVTATDGNHGRGVAWAASLFGSRAVVYMPRGSAEARRRAILDAGASEVTITERNYDGAVEMAEQKAAEENWILVQDTAWEGYETIPGWIIEGYLTLAAEAANTLEEAGVVPTHVFLQAGVGSMAGGALGYLRQRFGAGLQGIILEPMEAACVYQSLAAGDGEIHPVGGHPQTIMAGLNCGTPCSVIWPLLREESRGAAAVRDGVTIAGMRMYARPLGDDPAITAGESGAVSLGFLLEAMGQAPLKQALGLDDKAHILLINTEGDTDPDFYQKILG